MAAGGMAGSLKGPPLLLFGDATMCRSVTPLLAGLLLLAACSRRPPGGTTADSLAVAGLVRDRLAAALRGDTAAWHRHISDQALWTGPGLTPVLTPVVLPIIAANATLEPGAQELQDLAVHLHGDLAQATYLQLVRGPTGELRDGKRFRKTDTYQRQQDGWILVGAAEIAIPYRKSVTLPAAGAARLFGRYALPGVDTLTLAATTAGFRLVGLDGSSTNLLAADDTTLFEEGDPGDWVLRLAPHGPASALVYRMQGAADLVLPRVPGR